MDANNSSGIPPQNFNHCRLGAIGCNGNSRLQRSNHISPKLGGRLSPRCVTPCWLQLDQSRRNPDATTVQLLVCWTSSISHRCKRMTSTRSMSSLAKCFVTSWRTTRLLITRRALPPISKLFSSRSTDSQWLPIPGSSTTRKLRVCTEYLWRNTLEGRSTSCRQSTEVESLPEIRFEILVTRNPSDRSENHEFSVWLDLDYQRFISDVDMRYDVAGKIAHAFGSRSAREMAILRIGYGSVEFVWTNKTLSTQLPCPVDNLERLAMLMIFPNGTYNQEFSERVIPYRVIRVEFEPKFSCASAMTAKNAKPMLTYRDDDGASGTAISVLINDRPKSATDADERLLSTVVMPSLIVFAVLLLILPTLCFVYRRNSKNRTAGNLDSRSVKQGAPVIFANELEERSDFNAAAKPLIMTEEKQPVPPPFYDPAATANNSPLNARSSCREQLVSSEQDVDRPRTNEAAHDRSIARRERGTSDQISGVHVEKKSAPLHDPA